MTTKAGSETLDGAHDGAADKPEQAETGIEDAEAGRPVIFGDKACNGRLHNGFLRAHADSQRTTPNTISAVLPVRNTNGAKNAEIAVAMTSESSPLLS